MIPLSEYAIDQWWVKELESIHGCLELLTMDQYRAVNIARNFIHRALPEPFVEDTKILELALAHAYSLLNRVVEQNGTLPKHLIAEIKKILPSKYPASYTNLNTHKRSDQD